MRFLLRPAGFRGFARQASTAAPRASTRRDRRREMALAPAPGFRQSVAASRSQDMPSPFDDIRALLRDMPSGTAAALRRRASARRS